MKLNLLFIFVLFSLAITVPSVMAQNNVCSVYLTGIGCPHCAVADPVVLNETTGEYTNFFVIEYELYQQVDENGNVMISYDSAYGTGLGIPLLLLNDDISAVGDRTILDNIESHIESLGSNECPLSNGESIAFDLLDINTLPGKPNIWGNNRILIANEKGSNSELLRTLMMADDIKSFLSDKNFDLREAEPVPISGSQVAFENAVLIDGWIFQWNGEGVTGSECSCPDPSAWSECINNTQTRTNYNCSAETDYQCIEYTEIMNCSDDPTKELTLVKILSLAGIDAINPCAIAVLTLMLIAILTYNPKDKRKIILAGLAFVAAVFLLYMFYGLVIIQFFQVVQALTSVRLLLYTILGFVAIILGILNMKDYFWYKPGGLGTEMPSRLRPRVKKILSGITSPAGAFVIGAFVTIFLLPCTIGPYVIAGGILSTLELLQTIPWLLLYNIIFVIPMIVITVIIYKGIAHVDDVSGWKDKNIRYLHLIAGIIMALLGIGMIMGWI